MGHHKSNKDVERDPDRDHGGGMPLRPDQDELQERTEEDRLAVGLPADPEATPGDRDPDVAYQEESSEVDREAASGDLRPDADTPRKDRDPFPPTRHDD
jgi:hypothetical protein